MMTKYLSDKEAAQLNLARLAAFHTSGRLPSDDYAVLERAAQKGLDQLAPRRHGGSSKHSHEWYQVRGAGLLEDAKAGISGRCGAVRMRGKKPAPPCRATPVV